MVEQIPFVVVLHDGVVVGPAEYRSEDYAFVGVGAIKVLGGGVVDVVSVAGGVGQIIFPIEFVNPCGFKKATVAVGAE